MDFPPAEDTSDLAVYIVVKYEGFVRETVGYRAPAAWLRGAQQHVTI
ncbi:hypothetical protein [Paraburkholderia kirstenboschensis]|uniref:Uncharacterized protein n=1 Tax=Paraburkholderia kirstenboschensis TaxID=1245436 RepID=A0ABZ0EHU2_9BURK|nr:hypothetical protein [Paraburkholderia kirstenboschensis]WOD16788.1 hypothetical protein RW095_13005 [Paraburkholderia kirstenboschensis]